MTTRYRTVLGAVLTAGALLGSAVPASADPVSGSAAGSAAQARAQAAEAVRAATAAADAVQAAREQLSVSTEAVSSAVSASIGAQVEADRSASQAQRTEAAATQRVRSIYMSSGAEGARQGFAVLRSAVSGADPAVAVRAFAAVRRADEQESSVARSQASRASAAAEAADTGAVDAVVALRDVAAQVGAMDEALTRARARVEALEGEASRLQAAEDAAAALAAAQAAAAEVNAGAAQRASGVHARGVPASYAALYRDAATTCEGMRPELLGAVGQVESGHGVNVGPSSAGALGPMQFMPATFAAYGVDGDDDGDVDVLDPADAVFSAANYLCANGAGKGREAEGRALFRYNRADWYVQMVQRVADELAAQGW